MSDTVKKALEVSKKASKASKKKTKLLQDQYPTSYMPDVGRQVMAGGGMPDFSPFAVNYPEFDFNSFAKSDVPLPPLSDISLYNTPTGPQSRPFVPYEPPVQAAKPDAPAAKPVDRYSGSGGDSAGGYGVMSDVDQADVGTPGSFGQAMGNIGSGIASAAGYGQGMTMGNTIGGLLGGALGTAVAGPVGGILGGIAGRHAANAFAEQPTMDSSTSTPGTGRGGGSSPSGRGGGPSASEVAANNATASMDFGGNFGGPSAADVAADNATASMDFGGSFGGPSAADVAADNATAGMDFGGGMSGVGSADGSESESDSSESSGFGGGMGGGDVGGGAESSGGTESSGGGAGDSGSSESSGESDSSGGESDSGGGSSGGGESGDGGYRRGGRAGYAEGGPPTYDMMGNPLFAGSDEVGSTPGMYEKAMDVVSKYGQKVGEPAVELAKKYLEHTGKAAQEGSELMTEANRSARMQEGRLPINAMWQYPLGALQTAFSPISGAAQTAGEYATKATGDPTFGAKVAFAGEMVDPTHAGMFKKMLPGVLASVPAPGVLSKAASVSETLPKTVSAVKEVPEAVASTRQTTPLGFYSHAADVASGLKQAVKPQDALNWISKQPGVRKEELIAAGIIDDKGRMTPEFAAMPRVDAQTLSERVRTGAPDVTETVLPFKATQLDPRYKVMSLEEAKEQFPDEFIKGEYGPYVLVGPTGTGPSAPVRPLMGANDPSEFFTHFGLGSKYGPDVYPELTTPGGTNYREVVMRLPEKPYEVPEVYRSSHPMLRNESFNSLEDMYAKADELLNNVDYARRSGGLDDESYTRVAGLFKLDELRNRNFSAFKEVDETKNVDPNLRNFSHYTDQTNPVLHMRMQDVRDPGAGNVLRIEEIQSDWAQKGRKSGFRPTEAQIEDSKKAVEELKARMAENETAMIRTYGKDDSEYARLKDESMKIRQEMARHGMVLSNRPGRLPSAPYVGDTKNWTDLGVKRALLEAANKDYDAVQFIKGDVNRKRYGEAGNPNEDYGYHYDVNVPTSLKNILKKVDPEAKIESRRVSAHDSDMYKTAQKEYDYLVSEKRDIERRLDEMEEGSSGADDLHDQLYDIESDLEIAKYKLEAFATPDEFWEVKMTPKLREAIRQGLPRFADGGKVEDEMPVTSPEEPKKSDGGSITGWMKFNTPN